MWDTPLMAAAGNGHLEVVKYLVEHKADVSVENLVSAAVNLLRSAKMM